MTGDRRRFTVTAPDWGQDHLSPDAVVAYVDNELAERPFSRATRHLDECHECATRVRSQAQARSAIRSAQCPALPSSLLSSLRSIPLDAELPPTPEGLAVTPDGQFVTVLRPEAPVPARRRAPIRPAPMQTVPVRRPPTHRRMRLGAGAAVSGLALGALALGASGIASAPAAPAGATDRGVFNGPVLGGGPGGVVDARLRLSPPSSQPGRP